MTAPIDGKPSLSIIVTSYTLDRLQDLQDLLESLHSQSYQNMEIVLVGERDRELCDRVRAYAETRHFSNLRVVYNDGAPGLSAARDLGARYARAEILAFIDDDALAFPDWAEELVRSFSDKTIVGLTGPALPLWVDKRTGWLPQELYWIIGCTGWSEAKDVCDVRNVWGMNMAFRREAFRAAAGFSEEMGGVQGKRLHGEEVELSLRVRKETGGRIVYNPEVKVLHKVYSRRLSLRWIGKTSYWIGYTRHTLKGLCKSYGIDEDFLSVERRLLGRIVKGLLPRMLLALFVSPGRALRTLWIVAVALLFVAVGYFSHAFSCLGSDLKSMARGRGTASKA